MEREPVLTPGSAPADPLSGPPKSHTERDAERLVVIERNRTRVFDVRDYAAVGDGVADDTAAIEAAIANAEALTDGAQGALVYFPKGLYLVSQTITVPLLVTLRGAGTRATVIRASDTFTDPHLIHFGRGDVAWEHGCRVEQMSLNCNFQTAGVFTPSNTSEPSGLRDVVIHRWNGIGLHLEGEIDGENLELYGGPDGVLGVLLESMGRTPFLRSVTVVGDDAGPLEAGIKIVDSAPLLMAVHCERSDIGIDVHVGLSRGGGTIAGVSGHGTIPLLLRVRSTGGAPFVNATNIRGNGSAVTIQDDSRGVLLTGNVSAYTTRDLRVGRTVVPSIGSGLVMSRCALGRTATPLGVYGETLSLTNDRMFAVPLFVPPGETWNRVRTWVESGGSSGSVVRLGLYADSGAGVPGDLIADLGTVAATSPGAKDITISEVLQDPLVWLVIAGQGSPGTPPVLRALQPIVALSSAGSETHAGLGWFRNGISGALPASFGSLDGAGQNAPVINLRRA